MGCLSLTGTFGVATDDLDAVGMDVGSIVKFEVDVLDDKSPDVVAEAVRVEMALGTKVSSKPLLAARMLFTLNVRRALTLSARTSATALSKLARIFMASWGSIRRSVMRVSRVSVREPPTLCCQLECAAKSILHDAPYLLLRYSS